MLSSGHDMDVALRNSQQVSLPVQNLHTMEPVNIPAGQGGPLVRRLLEVNGC